VVNPHLLVEIISADCHGIITLLIFFCESDQCPKPERLVRAVASRFLWM
jgi:hypothetical protein